MKVPKRKSR